MPDENNYYKYLVPAVIAGVTALIYIGLSGVFVECAGIGCEAVKGELISATDEKKQKKISEIKFDTKPDSPSNTDTDKNSNLPTNTTTNSNSNSQVNTNTNSNSQTTPSPAATVTPANTNVNLSAVKAQVNKLKEDSDKLAESSLIKGIEQLQKEVEGTANSQIKQDAAADSAQNQTAEANEEEEQDSENKKEDSTANKTTGEKLTANEKEEKDLRKSLQQRYSSRISWVLLTSLLCTLFIGIVWFAYNLGRKALNKPAAVFLVAASCLIYYKVKKLNDDTAGDRRRIAELKLKLKEEPDDMDEESEDFPITSPPITSPPITSPPITSPPEPSREDLETELNDRQIKLTNEYKDWRGYSKALLYIGGAMLTIGLIRLQILFDWHTAFINSKYTDIIGDFFYTSL
jgi:hypothetical protein